MNLQTMLCLLVISALAMGGEDRDITLLERDRKLADTSIARYWMSNLGRLRNKNEKMQAILYSLTNLAEIIDASATRYEVEYEIGDHLQKVMNSVDQKDREMKKRFASLEEEAVSMKAEIDTIINQTRDDLATFMKQVRKDVLGEVKNIVRETLGNQRLEVEKVKDSAKSTIGQMKKNSNVTMIFYFLGFQALVGLCLYFTVKYTRESMI